jgi:hypothetical protein
MAQPAKLQVPQINRIRADDTHVADALQTIVDSINQNVTPVTGNKITPLNPLH